MVSEYYEYRDSLGVQNWVVEGDSLKKYFRL